MALSPPTTSRVVDVGKLPKQFPTHGHDALFWESLGRTIATFGFLEEILGKAIFSFTANKPYHPSEVEAAFKKWQPKLERALTDSLRGLIDQFGNAVREYPDSTIENLDAIIEELTCASRIRNVLVHGSWELPDDNGASVPSFVDKRMMVFDTAIDSQFLDRTQRHVGYLSCEIVSLVTRMGWQFPGLSGRKNTVFEE